MKKKTIIAFLLILILYYFVDYKRYFIYSDDKSEVFTIWKRVGWDFYIIPGKYYWPFAPKDNYIYASDQLMNVIFNTQDYYNYKIGVFYKEKIINEEWNVEVYKKRDSIDINYQILDSIDFSRKRFYNNDADSIRKALDYKLIQVENVYGIKVLRD